MKNDNEKIEKRLQNMRDFYVNAAGLIDNLPEVFPEKTRKTVKDAILGDEELKRLMEGVDRHRLPRIFLIGRTGVGKSSLINALCGSYVAKVSDTRSCTDRVHVYTCIEGNRALMEICDTRGIAESESTDPNITAEDMLIEQINAFSPDVCILVLSCTHRDDVNKDVMFLKRLADTYKSVNGINLPIVVAVNKCDEIAPARHKIPSEYPKKKIDKINEMVQYYKDIIARCELKIDNIIAVSSLIDWCQADGEPISVEDIDELPLHEIKNLEIEFDGRYQIEEFFDLLELAIQDFDARMGLRMAGRLYDVVNRVAKHLRKVFTSISMFIALTPIPVSDIYVLLLLQAVLVSLIASLSGRDLSIQLALEFIASIGAVSSVGYGFKIAAQQLSKLINTILPGAGSAISSVIAGIGTYAIGTAAISHFINDEPINEARKKFESARKTAQELPLI